MRYIGITNRQNLLQNILYLTGATIPFPAIGVQLSGSLLLSPAMVFGSIYALLSLLMRGILRPHLAAVGMLMVFVLTAAGRHPPLNYLFSIGALAVAIAPLTAPLTRTSHWHSLLRGFIIGLKLTIIIVAVELISQIFQIELVLDILKKVFVYGQQGSFLSYHRPKAGFLEPAHLAIYFGFSYLILDKSESRELASRWLRTATLVVLGVTGSLSGIVVVCAYLVVGWLQGLLRTRKKIVRSKTIFLLIIGLILTVVVSRLFSLEIGAIWGEYSGRVAKMIAAIDERNLIGSEGSRANAFLALPEFWSQTGAFGFLFGTGYANSEDWLLATYGHLGMWSTFGRGHVDSMVIAVFLSTGLVGLLAYVAFTISVFRRSQFSGAIGVHVFLILVNFAFGFLILYLYWYLIFILSTALQMRCVELRSNATQPIVKFAQDAKV